METIDDDELLYNMKEGTYEYHDQPFTGVAHDHSAAGTLMREIEYANGLQHGVARYWYPSGELFGEEYFRRSGRTGMSREWYQNGRLKRETEFEYSIRLREKQWDEEGNLVRDFVLTEDKPLFKTLQDFRRMYGDDRAS